MPSSGYLHRIQAFSKSYSLFKATAILVLISSDGLKRRLTPLIYTIVIYTIVGWLSIW